MNEKDFELYLFLDLIDIILFKNYLDKTLGITYKEKAWYSFLYNKNNRFIIKDDFKIDKSSLNNKQILLVKEVILAILWKTNNITVDITEYEYINILIDWYLKWCSIDYLNLLNREKDDFILLLYLLSKKNNKLIYPEYYDIDYLEKIRYLFEDSLLKNTFIVNFLYFIAFHCANFDARNIWKLEKSFSLTNSIDKSNPYLYSYYARFLIRTLWHIYKKHSIIKQWINYLLYSLNKLNSNDQFIYWWIASWYLYIKKYDKSVLFANKSINKWIYKEELVYLQLARWYIYWKIDIDKGINILKK